MAAYLEGMTKGLAVDLAPIRVNMVALGPVDTELIRSFAGGSQEKVKRMFETIAQNNLLEKVGSPEDVAEAYLYFMKDSFVTGQILISDGGQMLK